MNRSIAALGVALGLASLQHTHALAQSADFMMQDCNNNAHVFFQDFKARTATKYEGQRTDGSHAVNGTIHLKQRKVDFQCSYNATGDKMVDFFADGRHWPDFVKGKGSPHMAGTSGGSSVKATSSPAAAEVKFKPGTSGALLQGAVIGRDYFDYSLGARAGQTLHLDLRVRDTNGHGSIYFNVLPPGSNGVAIYNSSTDGNSDVAIDLPESGHYVVRLYLMGNDRDSGKTVGYDLAVEIR